ncbi:glycosyltransferase family 4 protein [Bryocella elongata]|uniref:glycosyltransferase family 4 protein n=1 Tax=Bryocella elongata TaxID=863522 RepID=UPI0038995C56
MSPSRQVPPRVHIYSHHSPAPNTTGPGLAICSQIQAFLDLGFEVDFVHLQVKPSAPPSHFKEISYTAIPLQIGKVPFYVRLLYLVGWPRRFNWRPLFGRSSLLREARARIRKDPDALHVFNYLVTAHIIPALPKTRAIFACHDIETEYLERSYAIVRAAEGRSILRWERRKLRRVEEMECQVVSEAKLVLCVSAAEACQINRRWAISNAAYLPLSVANDTRTIGATVRAPGEPLRLLHLGEVAHFPTLTSLEFLLTRVFPLLDAATLSQLELDVVGKLEIGDPSVEAVMAMARPYPQVRFTGFAPDLEAVYRRNHLQLVASQQATGVRTRIIESWAMGFPVLSTTVGAGGVEQLAPGHNILLVDEPLQFANCLRQLVEDSTSLKAIGDAGRATYDAHFSRPSVASRLRDLLARHVGSQLPHAAELLPEAEQQTA